MSLLPHPAAATPAESLLCAHCQGLLFLLHSKLPLQLPDIHLSCGMVFLLCSSVQPLLGTKLIEPFCFHWFLVSAPWETITPHRFQMKIPGWGNHVLLLLLLLLLLSDTGSL